MTTIESALPESIRREASILLRNHMLGEDLPDDECDDCIDLIAPILIRWALEHAAAIAEDYESIDSVGAQVIRDTVARRIRGHIPALRLES